MDTRTDLTRRFPRAAVGRSTVGLTVAALLLAWPRPAAALPPALVGYDPAGQVRFGTPGEADAKRQELIRFIWPAGLPGTTPAVTAGVGGGSEATALSMNLALSIVTPAVKLRRLFAA